MSVLRSCWLLLCVLAGQQLAAGWALNRQQYRSRPFSRGLPRGNRLCRPQSTSADVFFEEHLQSMAESALKQLSLVFDCERIDPDEISEVLLELGVLSVSVEVQGEKPDALNDEANWMDLIKTKSWSTALLRANVPNSFDADGLAKTIRSIYSDQPLDIRLDAIEDKDWVIHVQQMWNPQVIGDLTIRFPWHEDIASTTPHSLVLEGGAAFGTGDHPTTRLCCKWLQNHVQNEATLLDYGCGSAILGLGKYFHILLFVC